MGWSIYIRKGLVYLPTIAEAKSGFFLEIEPIEVADVNDKQAVREAVFATLARNRPVVPDPDPETYKMAPILALAGVKSWSTFYKNAKQLGVMRGESGYEIFRLKPYGRGFTSDETSRIKLPGNCTIAQVVDRVVDEIERIYHEAS